MRRDPRPGNSRCPPTAGVSLSRRGILPAHRISGCAISIPWKRLIPGTEGAWFPFWSPDGRFIGFQTPSRLKRIVVSGGPPETLCDVRGRDGAAWSPTRVIVFAQAGKGLYQVPASGGISTPLTALEPSRKETVHEWPQFLPDRRHFLYFADSLDAEHRGIYVASLASDEPRLILNTEVQATYAKPGYLLFLRGATLMAQPFDADSMKLTGGRPASPKMSPTIHKRTGRASSYPRQAFWPFGPVALEVLP